MIEWGGHAAPIHSAQVGSSTCCAKLTAGKNGAQKRRHNVEELPPSVAELLVSSVRSHVAAAWLRGIRLWGISPALGAGGADAAARTLRQIMAIAPLPPIAASGPVCAVRGVAAAVWPRSLHPREIRHALGAAGVTPSAGGCGIRRRRVGLRWSESPEAVAAQCAAAAMRRSGHAPPLPWSGSAWRTRLFHRDGVCGGGGRRRDCAASPRRDPPELAGCPRRRLRAPIAPDPLGLPCGAIAGPSPAAPARQAPSRLAAREARPRRPAGPAPSPQWLPPGPAP